MQPFPHPNDASVRKLIAIGTQVAEIFMFESVDTQTHRHTDTDTQTDGQTPARLVYYKPPAQVS